MRAFAAGEVVVSNDPDMAVGEHVGGLLGVQEYAVASGKGVFKVDTSLAPLPVYLGALGMPGVTAYFGLLDIGRPEAGNTVVVSGAAGAVGGLVGQIAKLQSCRVVGIAGGPEKCRHVVEELGFDAAIDYKGQDVDGALGEHCPNGIDVYFDNVGGDILDAALAHLARHARVVICGAISQYNATGAMRGPSNYLSLLVNHASMTGFVMSDYLDRYAEAVREMAGWLAAGKLVSREDIAEGLESFPDTLLRLFNGENTGKLVLRLADD
jgi:NADPH-dependent curcumin reductase CurA